MFKKFYVANISQDGKIVSQVWGEYWLWTKPRKVFMEFQEVSYKNFGHDNFTIVDFRRVK